MNLFSGRSVSQKRTLLTVLLAAGAGAMPGAAAAQRDYVDAHARAFVDALRDGDVAFGLVLFSLTYAELDSAEVRAGLRLIADSLAIVPASEQATLINRRTGGAVGGTLTELTYAFGDSAGQPAVIVTLQNLPDRPHVVGVHWGRVAAPSPATLKLTNGSAAGYLALTVGLMLAAFSLAVAVQTYRSRMPRRVWWALLALVGTGQVVVAWEGGTIESHLLAVQLLSFGIVKHGSAPWVVTFAFPAGALLARQRRRTHLERQRQAELAHVQSVANGADSGTP